MAWFATFSFCATVSDGTNHLQIEVKRFAFVLFPLGRDLRKQIFRLFFQRFNYALLCLHDFLCDFCCSTLSFLFCYLSSRGQRARKKTHFWKIVSVFMLRSRSRLKMIKSEWRRENEMGPVKWHEIRWNLYKLLHWNLCEMWNAITHNMSL